MRKGWWTKSLLLVFVLPWATPALPAYISAFDIAAGSGPKTFHVRRLKGSVDSVHSMRELNCTFPGAGATTRLGCAKGMASSEDGRGVV
jgi:hypothetical protein